MFCGVDQARDDANDVTVAVHQRAARVARIDGSVELDKSFQCLTATGWREGAVESRDDARGHRTHQPKRIPDSEYLISDPHSGTPNGCRHEDVGRCVRHQNCYVILRLFGGDGRQRSCAIREYRLDLGSVLDIMQCGEDGAVAVDNHAATDGCAGFLFIAVAVTDDALRPDEDE